MSDTFEHGRNCAANIPGNDEDCTCGLRWRIQVRTEQEMHAAWRKRAEEAEAELSLSRQKVEELERELAHEKSRHCIGGDIFEAGRNRLILNQATELEYLQRAEAAEQQAASSAALAGQMRVALEQCRSHWGGYCITKDDQYKSVMENFWKHIRKCDIIIDAALSLPPSNALKKHEAALVDKLADDRHQCARELRDDGYVQAANDMDEHGDWLREKANELRASALESECAEAGKDVGDGIPPIVK